MPASQPSVVPVPEEDRLAFLDALAAELKARGWIAYIAATLWRAPRLFVQHPQQHSLTETVLAAPDDASGQWWYWFSHAERIAPADSTALAAEKVIQALSPGTGSTPADGPATAGPEYLPEGLSR
jgi:hypothetical protein